MPQRGAAVSIDADTFPIVPDPRRSGFKPIALSLSLGALGGGILTILHVPLAWMLGPMLINIAASMRGLPVFVPDSMRIVVLAVIGVFVGSSFSPELFARAGAWLSSLGLMLIFVPLITFAAAEYFRRVAGFNRATAVFAGAPGTLSAMVAVCGGAGADERVVTIAQGLRVVMVVVIMPLIVTGVSVVAPHVAATPDQAGWPPFNDGALLAIAAVIGIVASRLTGQLPIAMTAAMLTTMVLYLTGLVTYHPPDALLWMMLLVLGSAVGSRFAAVSAKIFLHAAKHAVIATLLVVAVSAVFALIASTLTQTSYLTALLSFTPGGVAEMCLIAIAFDIDPAYVAVHHLLRIAILIMAAPLVARLLGEGKC